MFFVGATFACMDIGKGREQDAEALGRIFGNLQASRPKCRPYEIRQHNFFWLYLRSFALVF